MAGDGVGSFTERMLRRSSLDHLLPHLADRSAHPGPAMDGVAGTGLAVAAARAAESARPDRLFADPLASAFVAASGWAPPEASSDRRRATLRAWVVARTVFLDELALSACTGGCQQVVLLGAGLDARAFRLPWPPGVRCFELDTAEVLDSKAEVLTAQAAQAACERLPVPGDLRGDWPAALLAAGFRPDQPAVRLAEGLLVYLTQGQVDSVLAGLTALSAPGSQLGLTLPSSTAGSGEAGETQWLAGHGWAARFTGTRDVLAAHGRPVRAQPAGQRSRALLVAATRTGPPAQAGAQPPATSARTKPPATSARTKPPATSARTKPPATSARPRWSTTPSGQSPSPGPDPDSSPAERPWPVLLSQLLVAFTIELDNEFEHQFPHRTTRGPAAGSRGPWLVSLAMWSNLMRFIPPGGVCVADLPDLTGMTREATESQLTRMSKWWGYLTVEPDPADRRPRPPRRDWIAAPTPAGRQAQRIWRPLGGVIEQRWQDRFGAAAVGRLTGALRALGRQLDPGLPHYLPVGGTAALRPAGPRPAEPASRDLPALLSQALLALAAEFEAGVAVAPADELQRLAGGQ